MHRALLGALLGAAALVSIPAAHAQMKVGVVSLPQLAEQSPQAKQLAQSLEDEFKPRQREIVTQEKELKAREEKFTRDSAVMSESERTKAERELREAQRELARKKNEFVEDLNVRRNEELQRLQKALVQEVQAYARAQGFDLVMGDGVIFAKDSINITPGVLSAMKAKAPAATAPAAQPKPAEKKQ
jgi:outer membrane protein